MTPEQIDYNEKLNTGTSWTRNSKFEQNGYLVLSNLYDAVELVRPLPHYRGTINYWGKKIDQFNYEPIESQVDNSLSTYNHPQYRQIHTNVRLKLEKIIGRKLYNTYYYDRFYWTGQELAKHTDRDACEISVTLHIGSSLRQPWPILIKSVSGKNKSVDLFPGDAMLYKGCERPHWRDPMPGDNRPGMEDWYHQVFFHYVLADGERAHCAGDLSR